MTTCPLPSHAQIFVVFLFLAASHGRTRFTRTATSCALGASLSHAHDILDHKHARSSRSF